MKPDDQLPLPLKDHPLQKVYELINERVKAAHEAQAERMKYLRRSLGQKIRWMK